MKALVVEDDPSVAEPLIAGLERNGIEVAHVAYAAHVLDALRGVDVVLLDLGLPDGEGLDVLRDIRRTSDVPVIIATARGEEADRIIGLELGADDYVVKPFSVRELAARIRAIARPDATSQSCVRAHSWSTAISAESRWTASPSN